MNVKMCAFCTLLFKPYLMLVDYCEMHIKGHHTIIGRFLFKPLIIKVNNGTVEIFEQTMAALSMTS